MVRYCLFKLIRFVVESKELQALLIVTGGIVVLIFVPYWVGAITNFFIGTTDCIMATWAFGVSVMLIGLIVGAILFNIYREILAKLEKTARREDKSCK